MAADDEDQAEDHEQWERRFERGDKLERESKAWGPRFDGPSVPGHAPVPGAASWRSVGPLNLAGRIRCLALDPVAPGGGAPHVVYAGSASGGVFRTLDGAQTWESIWPDDMPSFTIGAIAVGATGAGARSIWVATGETNKQTGSGVWRAELAAGVQGPVAFAQIGDVSTIFGGVADPPTLQIEAAAADPDDPSHCWFVSAKGVFRFRAGAWDAFEHSAAGGTRVPYTDVKFVRTPVGRYVLLSRGDTRWGDLVLIDDPDDTPVNLQARLTAAVVGAAPIFAPDVAMAAPMLPAAPPPPIVVPTRRCTNACIDIVPATTAAGRDRAYVVYATHVAGADEPDPLHSLRHAAAIEQDPGTARARWVPAAQRDWDDRSPPMTDDQGDYNLCLAASPANGDVVAVGLVNLQISNDAGLLWEQALDRARYATGDWGQHADQHSLIFVPRPAGIPALWVGNDGGVAISTRYIDPVTGTPPTRAGRYRWRRRIHGLVVSQAYDIAQSPLLPEVQAVALQDIGGWLTAGSTTWYHAQGGDGIAMGFDGFDPYRLVTTWQGSANSLAGAEDFWFLGDMGKRREARRIRVPAPAVADLPPLPRPPGRVLVRFRGFAPNRVLAKGLIPDDRATFDETITHPTQPGRMIHLRERRAYFTEDGETWRVCNAGNRGELFARMTHEGHLAATLGGVTVEIDGSAAIKLGFVPGLTSDLRHHTGTNLPPAVSARAPLEIYRVRYINGAPGPYRLDAGDRLVIAVDVLVASRAAPNRYRATAEIVFPDTRAYRLDEIVTRVQAALPAGTALVWTLVPVPPAVAAPPVALPADVVLALHFLPAWSADANTVVVVSEARGPAAEVFIDGTAAAALRVQQRQYLGDAGRPAVAVLHANAEDVLPGVEAAAPGMVLGEFIDLTTHTSTPHHHTLHYSFPAVGVFDRYAPPLRERMQVVLDDVARTPRRPSVRIWATQAKKYLRLWSGRAATPPFLTFRFPADPISTARAGITSANPTRLDRVDPFAVVDLESRLWGRYDLTPSAGPGPDSVLRIQIDTTPPTHVDITFTAAAFGGSLTGVTAEEARRVINAALAGSDVFCDVQHEYQADGPTEAAFSAVDDRVLWLGAQWGGLHVSRDRGDTWTDLTDYADESLLTRTVEAIAPDDTRPGHPADPIGALVGMSGHLLWVPTRGAKAYREIGLSRPAGYVPGGVPKIFALERGSLGSGEVFAGTDVGVFRSPDNGDNWDLFNQGLPAVMATDLAYEPSTETLRVATWGRGVYERVTGAGPRAPARLFVRANDRDTGRGPAPHGPALSGERPAAATAFESPDVRITRLPAADLDSVELDELASEPVIPGLPYAVLVRGHNGTHETVAGVRLIALWADASRQVPSLPAQLWTDVGNAPPLGAGPWGPWRLIGEAAVGAIQSGSAKIGRFSHTWAPVDVTGLRQLAVLLIAVEGRNAVEAGPSETALLATNHPQLALRMVPVQPVDVTTITLEVLAGARFAAFTASAPVADPFVFTGVPGPRVVSSAATATFNVDRLRFQIDLEEPWPAPLPPTVTSILIDFDDGNFTSPTAATPAEVRAFFARALARDNRLARVVAPVPTLALARSPGDGGARIGGAAWSSAELVVTAPGTAATAADFTFLRLLAPAAVAIGAAQRFSVRVHNRGGVDAVGATLTVYVIDPRAETPTLTAINAVPAAVPTIPGGGSGIGFVEGVIAGVSGADVTLLAVVDHPDDPAPVLPPLPTTWPVVLALNDGSDNLAMRLLRRA